MDSKSFNLANVGTNVYYIIVNAGHVATFYTFETNPPTNNSNIFQSSLTSIDNQMITSRTSNSALVGNVANGVLLQNVVGRGYGFPSLNQMSSTDQLEGIVKHEGTGTMSAAAGEPHILNGFCNCHVCVENACVQKIMWQNLVQPDIGSNSFPQRQIAPRQDAGNCVSVESTTRMPRKVFKCTQCTRRFYQLDHLRMHTNSHDFHKSYKCSVCGEKFPAKEDLLKHKRMVLSCSKQFMCEACGKQFSESSELKCHIIAHHGGLKEFKCPTCGKEFAVHRRLKYHMQIHTDLHRFKCDICARDFNRQSSLEAHIGRHAGLKKFSCTICAKGFFERYDLDKHMLTHTGVKQFVCEVCNKAFCRRAQLVVHMIVHTGLKRFKCDVCMKEFAQKHQVTSHMSTHTGFKDFKCEFCGRDFAQRSALNKHLTRHESYVENLK